MMKQYSSIKADYPSMILFFRLGDFYEMFNQDAVEVSRLLNLTLTKRHTIPMCGIPYHAATNYISRLLRLGKRIAICEQVSEPGQKGIVDRKVTRIMTPGTVVEDEYLDKSQNNYLMSLAMFDGIMHCTCADVSTAEFFILDLKKEQQEEDLRREIYRLQPREILVQESLMEEIDWLSRLLVNLNQTVINRLPDWCFDRFSGYQNLLKHFKVQSLHAFSLSDNDARAGAAGALLDYLADTSGSLLPQIKHLALYDQSDKLSIDDASARNLEIVRNIHDSTSRFSLVQCIDFTRTGMGARKLYNRISAPLTDLKTINDRLDSVEFFYRNQILLSRLQSVLSKVLDLERLNTRLLMDKAHPKDLVSIKCTVLQFSELYEVLADSALSFLPVSDLVQTAREIWDLLERALQDDPSLHLHDGNVIRTGYSPELDRFRMIENNAQKILDDYLEEEKANSGITNLRIKYNKIIGYFLEVSKGQIDNVPAHFLRKQSLVNGERFSTAKLATIEEELSSANEKTVELEKQLFQELKETLRRYCDSLSSVAGFLGDLDFYQSLAQAATANGYVRPVLESGTDLEIKGGRHPVVERNLQNDVFVTNDTVIYGDKKPFHLITGPNMAGKSTFLRQTALIVIMAQTGSFVPAESARIGIVDKLFCRVGASDNLARGQSTFLVEMSETALILRQATIRSLVIMDEVGRGTGTIDGLSIAWAVSDYLMKKTACRTLFATHYHELTAMSHQELENYSMSVDERGGKILFLKKLKKGPSSQSFGLHVAELAGIPRDVIEAAKQVMKTLNSPVHNLENLDIQIKTRDQTLFPEQDLILHEISSLTLDNMTPLHALNLLSKWKQQIKKK